jgi:serine/threonine-protein kinase
VGGVIPAPRGRLIRRSLETMFGCVVARRYRITDTIGSGGMGSVYEAIDLQTGCAVALKALQPGAYDPIRLKRLRREAKTMTAVRSEHVCQVHHLGVERGTPFIVMERLHGETLRNRLTEEGALSASDAVAITCQLLDALTATHAAGIIHRDVKPSNVFLASKGDESPRVKLIDFGLAKIVRSDAIGESEVAIDNEISSSEVVAGTLHFLAPEQLLAVGDLDERVDVYAAGVTFFEMLTGHRAYRGTYSEIIHDIVFNPPPKVTETRQDLPGVFDDVLAMAMAKSRDRRFASAAAFKRALLAAWESVRDRVQLRSGVCPTLASSTPPEARGEVLALANDASPSPMALAVAGEEPDATMIDPDLPTLRPPPAAALPAELSELGVGQIPSFKAPPFISEE